MTYPSETTQTENRRKSEKSAPAFTFGWLPWFSSWERENRKEKENVYNNENQTWFLSSISWFPKKGENTFNLFVICSLRMQTYLLDPLNYYFDRFPGIPLSNIFQKAKLWTSKGKKTCLDTWQFYKCGVLLSSQASGKLCKHGPMLDSLVAVVFCLSQKMTDVSGQRLCGHSDCFSQSNQWSSKMAF